jgi:hypothetical protein
MAVATGEAVELLVPLSTPQPTGRCGTSITLQGCLPSSTSSESMCSCAATWVADAAAHAWQAVHVALHSADQQRGGPGQVLSQTGA